MNDMPEISVAQQRLRRRANLATIAEASEILGVARCVIQSWVNKGRLGRRRSVHCRNGKDAVLVDLEDAEILRDLGGEMWKSVFIAKQLGAGETIDDIAKDLGVKAASVVRWMQRHAVHRRKAAPRARAQRPARTFPGQFQRMTLDR